MSGVGLAAVVFAVATLAATGRGPVAPSGQPPVLTVSPSLRAAQIASQTAVPSRSGHLSAPAGPTWTPGPAVAPSLTSTPEAAALSPDAPALEPPPRPGPFAIDLYREGDFVGQARRDWCVPASMLTMINMIDRAGDRSTPTQAALNRLARELSTPRLQGAGSEPEGWAGTLNQLGYGPYAVHVEPTRAAAIGASARAVRLTGRPVGLLIWRGAHAWVVSGFRATADPAWTDDFTVTHLSVEDPWYPRLSSIWGRSRPPGALVPVKRVAQDYIAWRRPTVRYPEKDGQFVLVIPVAAGPDPKDSPAS